jgi:hypothetical protein
MKFGKHCHINKKEHKALHEHMVQLIKWMNYRAQEIKAEH